MIETTTNIKTEKQLIPAIRFKEFKGEWNKDKLGNLSSNISYGIGAAATEFDGVNKYLRITDIDEDTREFKPNPLTSPEGGAGDKYKLKKGDIVFARTGASVGKSYLYKETDGNLIYAGFLIKFNINKADPRFIYALTFNESYDKWVHVFSMRSGQPGLNAEEYKGFKINLPSLPEQQKIAAFLSAIDEKVQQLTKKKELLEQYKKGGLQQLFSGQLRFKDQNGNPYPDWEEKRLGLEVTEYKEKSKVNDEYEVLTSSNKGLMLQSEYYGENRLTERDNLGFNIVPENHITFRSRSDNRKFTFNLNNLGLTGVISTYYPVFKSTNGSSFFIVEMLNYNQNFIGKYSVGTSQTVLSMNELKRIKFKFPCSEEQQKIARYLSSIDTKIESVNNQITQTQTFKKGLLQQMFV